jgi:lipopolysaccharide/colanic/teichoic acid biosynthesis glycosyltransferase
MATSNSWQRIHAQIPASVWGHFGTDTAVAPESTFSGKRLLDLITATLALVILLPVLLIIALAVKLDSRGPVLFRSRRIGNNGRVFDCLKFRTMTGNAWVTRIGMPLRRFGLDELPQLFNVLKGDMSVVGPRPVLAGDAHPPSVQHLRRFAMKPGMTGLWQVHEDHFPLFGGYESADDRYRESWSVWVDLSIMLRSVAAAFHGGGC